MRPGLIGFAIVMRGGVNSGSGASLDKPLAVWLCKEDATWQARVHPSVSTSERFYHHHTQPHPIKSSMKLHGMTTNPTGCSLPCATVLSVTNMCDPTYIPHGPDPAPRCPWYL